LPTATFHQDIDRVPDGARFVSEPKDAPTMNTWLDPKTIAEATRLVRAGRLAESTALLQRMMRGAAAPRTAAGHHDDISGNPAGRPPPVIDGEFRTVAETEGATPARLRIAVRPAETTASTDTAAKAQLTPGGLRGLFDRIKRGAWLRLHEPMRPPPAATPDVVPTGGQFIEAVYSNAAGSRAYKLYIPSGYHGQAVPLVVMLHGCTQSPDDFAAGTRMNTIAEEQTCLVAYPAQASNANAAKCWNWFRPGDQRRGQGEPSLIAGITRQIMRDYVVDPGRVYVGGLSAGAAAAAVMGAAYPDLFAAIGVHSGLACGAASDVPSAFAAMRQGESALPSAYGDISAAPGHGPTVGPTVPTIVFHGDADTTVHPRNSDHVIAQAIGTTSAQTKVQRGRIPGGHAYTRTIHCDASGRSILEQWEIHGAGHAWSGGSPAGSYTDPRGPDAAREMLRFFLQHQISGSAPQ
jgi:poly(hydroxyalkanoate) depolymerase family esterase